MLTQIIIKVSLRQKRTILPIGNQFVTFIHLFALYHETLRRRHILIDSIFPGPRSYESKTFLRITHAFKQVFNQIRVNNLLEKSF